MGLSPGNLQKYPINIIEPNTAVSKSKLSNILLQNNGFLDTQTNVVSNNTLEKTEGTITNVQSRETGNIYRVHNTKTNKAKTQPNM